MGFMDGWRSAHDEPRDPLPKLRTKTVETSRDRQANLPFDDNRAALMAQAARNLQEKAQRQADAFDALVRLARRHIGNKLDAEIAELQRDIG